MKFLKLSKEEMIIGLLAIGTYLICLINDFHTDDWIVMNILRDGFSFSDFVSMENVGRFRPLTNIIVYIRYLAFGDLSVLYYALNIVLHSIVCVSLYRLLLKLELPEKAALLSAIFFAVYFQHYEAVLWLYGIIRELAALFYIISLWHLHDYLMINRRRSFWVFVVFSSLGLFVVEDFVIAPAVFAILALIFGKQDNIWKSARPVVFAGVSGLAVYFIVRSLAIARPGITEAYYYPGFHMIRVLFEYLGWFVVPSPAHPYFKPLAERLPASIYYIWRAISYLAIYGFVPLSIWLFIKSSKQVRFFIIFVFVAMLPIIPLNYKVSSRNIYLPSLGLAVVAGYMLYDLFWRSRSASWIKGTVFASIIVYTGLSVAAINVTSLEYRRTQTLVDSIIADLHGSGSNLNDYRYVLLDHVPGRAIIGPAMIYRLHFEHFLLASNDPVKGPIDIDRAADSLYNESVPIIVFDYRRGHMVEATADYIPAEKNPAVFGR